MHAPLLASKRSASDCTGVHKSRLAFIISLGVFGTICLLLFGGPNFSQGNQFYQSGISMYSIKRAATLPATIAPMFLRSLTHPAVGAIATVSGVNRGVAAQRRSLRSFADISQDAYDPPSQKVAFMFPGQGAQYLGMGADLVENVPKAKSLFDKASEILGYDLLELCKEGPKEKLDSTAVSQPAIFVASMAAVEKLKQEKGDNIVDDASVTMGLSLGEYSALCFAGAISFEDGVRLVQERGAAMQAAADMVESSMASVIGLSSEKVDEICSKASEETGKPVRIANYLCNGNYAVSGAKEAIDKVMEIAKPEFKARMAVKLAVAGAFHTDFMKPAVQRLETMLDTVEVKEPRIPVVSNVDGKAHKDPQVIKELLTQQVTSPVMWENTMASMLESDFENAYEIGPGKVLTGILKRFKRDAEFENVEA
mmetsp:Transcript_11331/g.13486  ORF Transcript_11331/g.13486 Transcript_11331/m.13486 type:complete len:425 (+) Transcript_11331:58-1332(+)